MAKISEFFDKHPTKHQLEVKFKDLRTASTKICHDAQIVSISDFGIKILVDPSLHYATDQIVELSSSVLNEIPLKNPLLEVTSVKIRPDQMKEVRLMFIEENPESVKKIRRWISYTLLKKEAA